jgi:CRP/FNR family transcriptional regulator
MTGQQTIGDLFPVFEKELLQEIQAEANIRHFEAGVQLMRPGQYIRSSILVIDGLVKVYREDDEGNEFFMYYLQPGQACALSMICTAGKETSKISAKTVQPTDVVLIPVEKMDEWLMRYKSWNHFVLQNYRSRFEELLQTLDSIAFRNMDERLEFYLQRHAKTLDTKLIPVTHQEIAQELNSSREVISRLLKKLAERGKIKLNRNSIEILNL